MKLYRWNARPELVRAILVALGAFLVQQPVDTLDRIWSSDQPVKAAVALAIAAAQFVIARLLAAIPPTPPPPPPSTTHITASGPVGREARRPGSGA